MVVVVVVVVDVAVVVVIVFVIDVELFRDTFVFTITLCNTLFISWTRAG